MRLSDENLITCTQGHTTARKLWRMFDMDPAYLCCPVCGELSDLNVSEIAQPASAAPIPVGRHSAHVVSLIRKCESWQTSRRTQGYNGGCLSEVIKYLGEYRDLLAASDLELAAGHDLDRLLDPLPRAPAETDAEFRERAKRAPVADHQAISIAHAVRELWPMQYQQVPVPSVVTREDVERAERIADDNRPIGTRDTIKLIVPL